MLIAVAFLLATAPEISAVVSGADNSSAELGIAPGSIITVYGRNLATSAGSRVLFGSAEGRLLYVSASQINAIVPAELGATRTQLLVQTSDGESTPYNIPVVEARFTAFTTTGRPFGPALIQQYRPGGITLNRLLDPSVPGDTLVIWGTGLGGQTREDVAVWIGGTPVKPFYAGPAPGLDGVDQINFTRPGSLVSRCFLPLMVRVGELDSGAYTITTNTQGGACPTELAFGEAGLRALDQGGHVQLTVLNANRDAVEFWTGEYDSALLSLVANYDFMPGAASISCSRSGYSYTRSNPPRVSMGLPTEFYGLTRVGSGAPTAQITGPGGCLVPLVESPQDGVYRSAGSATCTPTDYAIRDPNGISSAAGPLPLSSLFGEPPAVSVQRRSEGGAMVAWSNPSLARLTTEITSSFTLPGSIFNGQTDVRVLSCLLTGYAGTGQISKADLDWGLGLPTSQAVRYRLSLTSGMGGSWNNASHALLIRTFGSLQGEVQLAAAP